MIEQLSQLPSTSPAPHDADRIRNRCHAALANREPAGRSRVDAVLFAAAAVYLVSAVIHMLMFFGPSVP